MFFYGLGVAFPPQYFCCTSKMKCGRNTTSGSYTISSERVSSKQVEVTLTGRLSCATEVVSTAAKWPGDHGLLSAECQSKAKSHTHQKLAFTCQIQAQNCFLIWGEKKYLLLFKANNQWGQQKRAQSSHLHGFCNQLEADWGPRAFLQSILYSGLLQVVLARMIPQRLLCYTTPLLHSSSRPILHCPAGRLLGFKVYFTVLTTQRDLMQGLFKLLVITAETNILAE